uniref:Uncharacterized protein n=1 Tax=Clytia hemisphaerica TaxID=252671 RepID=A0A7M5UJX4_9CNID
FIYSSVKNIEMSTSKTPDIEKDAQNVDDARSKLEDILNDIFDKNEDGQTPANNLGDDKAKRVNPTSYTPTKKNFSGRYARKNKKKKDLFQNESYNKKQKRYPDASRVKKINVCLLLLLLKQIILKRCWVPKKT